MAPQGKKTILNFAPCFSGPVITDMHELKLFIAVSVVSSEYDCPFTHNHPIQNHFEHLIKTSVITTQTTVKKYSSSFWRLRKKHFLLLAVFPIFVRQPL